MATIRRNIFDYLKKIHKDDLKKIKNYLDSPYFKVDNRARVIGLFKLLKNDHPKYENIDDNLLAKKLSVQVTTLRNLKSTLINCIEHYLELKILDKKEALKSQLRAQVYEELNMPQLFKRYANKQLNKLQKKSNYDQEDYMLEYELLIRKYGIIPHDMLNVKNIALIEAINTLSHYYLYECLKNLNGIITANRTVDRGAKKPFTLLTENSVNTIEVISDINIKVSYLIYKFFILESDKLKEKENTYTTLKTLVWKNWEKLTDDCKYEAYQHMVNMANDIRVALSFEKFVDEAFVIHQFWIEKKAHLIYPEMNYNLFLSAVISSCNANKLDWCKKFISINKLMLPIRERTSTMDLSLAYYNFSIGQIDEAIEKLNTIDLLGVYFNLLVRMLMLRCLFVAKYESRFIHYYNHTYNFIRNHEEINKITKKEHLAFIQNLKKIRNARLQNDIQKLIDIKNKIQTDEKNQISNWMLKKINELINVSKS